MKVLVEVSEALSARIALDPQTKDLPMNQALLALVDRALQAAEYARKPEVFAAQGLEHVATFEIGRVFSLVEAIPRNASYDTNFLRALAIALRKSPMVEVLPESEHQHVPIGHGHVRRDLKRIQEA